MTSDQWKDSLRRYTSSCEDKHKENESFTCQETHHYNSPFRELIKNMPSKTITLNIKLFKKQQY